MGKAQQRQGCKWVDSTACSALCQLILDDECKCTDPSAHGRPPLPTSVYAQQIAPFLRFEGPVPGMLYAFGGRRQRQGPVDTVEMLDTWHGCWVPCREMPTRRAGSAACALPDGRIIVVGGYDSRGIDLGLLSTCDLYNPATECWEVENPPPLKQARWGHGCALLNGKVWAVGGCSLQGPTMATLKSCEIYDPEENSWSPGPSLHKSRSGARVVVLQDRYLLAVGGCDDVFGRGQAQSTIEIYDAALGHWRLLSTQLSEPRSSAAVAVLDGGRIFITGGAPSRSPSEIYRVISTNDGLSCMKAEEQALETDDVLDGFIGCQAATVSLPNCGTSARRCVVVVGGERCEQIGNIVGQRKRKFSPVAALDVATGSWLPDTQVPAMTKARTTVALCLGQGRVTKARLC